MFRRIHLWVFMRPGHFDSWRKKGLLLAEILESKSERNTMRNDDEVGILIALITIIMLFVFIKQRKLTWRHPPCTQIFYSVVTKTAIDLP